MPTDTDGPPLPWRETAEGLVITVRLTPRGGRDRLEGIVEVEGRAMLKARVAPPPVDGAANDALLRLIAKAAGVPASAAALVSGAAGRVKQVRLAGDARAMAARLAGRAAG